MQILIYIIVGLLFWYFYYSLELFLNGMRIFWYSPFYYLFWHFLFCLPFFGKYFKLKWAKGNKEWTDMMPGRIAFVYNHIFIPFIPYFFGLVINSFL